MTFAFAPYSSGSGSAMTDAQWGEFAKGLLGTGVIKGALIAGSAGNDLAVTAPGSGMTVNLGTGQAMVYGHWCQNDASAAQTITTADPTNPRIDRVVLKHDVTAKTVSIVVKAGTPAPSPTAPSLTQTPSTWEMSLAQVRVNAGVSAINSGNVTDERTYAAPALHAATHASGGTDALTPAAIGAVATTGGTMTGKPNVQLTLGGSIQEFVRMTASDGKTYSLCLNTDGTWVLRNITDGVNVLIIGPTADAIKTGSNATIWHANNDGPGSGLDADTVDGVQAAALAALAGATFTGTVNVSSGSLQQGGKGVVVTGAGNLATTPIQLVVVGPSSANLPTAGVKGRVGIVAPFSLP